MVTITYFPWPLLGWQVSQRTMQSHQQCRFEDNPWTRSLAAAHPSFLSYLMPCSAVSSSVLVICPLLTGESQPKHIPNHMIICMFVGSYYLKRHSFVALTGLYKWCSLLSNICYFPCPFCFVCFGIVYVLCCFSTGNWLSFKCESLPKYFIVFLWVGFDWNNLILQTLGSNNIWLFMFSGRQILYMMSQV